MILETAGFTEIGRIESPFFKSSRANGSASPHGIALTGDGNKLYIGLENADSPDRRLRHEGEQGPPQNRRRAPGWHFLAIQPGTDKLYYPMRDDNRVLVIDTKTDAITKIITVNGGPVGVGFAPNGEVWIHCDGDGSVAVIDGKRDSVVATVKNLGQGPGRTAVSATANGRHRHTAPRKTSRSSMRPRARWLRRSSSVAGRDSLSSLRTGQSSTS